MFEIILSYVSALCTIPSARSGSAAADHGWRNNSVLRAFGELQIWIRHFPDSRFKHDLNNGDKKQEGGRGASTTEGLKALCGLAVMFVFL